MNYLYPTSALEYTSNSLHWGEMHIVNSSGQQIYLQWRTERITTIVTSYYFRK